MKNVEKFLIIKPLYNEFVYYNFICKHHDLKLTDASTVIHFVFVRK